MLNTIRNILLISLVSTSATAASVDDIVFVTENYPPFNFEKDGDLQGVSVDTLAPFRGYLTNC